MIRLLALLLVLLASTPAWGAVARDANGTPHEQSSNTVHNYGALDGAPTIGLGSNRALIVQLIIGTDPGGTPTVVLNPDTAAQALTQIVTVTSGTRRVYLFGLLAPASGVAVLRSTTINAVESIMSATSYTGVDQTSIAVAFPNATSATGSSTTVSVTITSATGNMTVDCFTAPVGSATPSQTQLFFLSGAGAVDGGSSEAAGSASNTHQWTITSAAWGAVGTDIRADDATSATTQAPQRSLLGVGQ